MNTSNTTRVLGELVRFSRVSTDFFIRLLRGIAWPKVELLIRLCLAKIFFVSGVLKLTHWQTALELAAHEYPVRFLSPVAAAYLGVFIEVLSPVLLAFGFMTRYAAVSMLGLSLVIQFAYRPFDSQLFWAALFGWKLDLLIARIRAARSQSRAGAVPAFLPSDPPDRRGSILGRRMAGRAPPLSTIERSSDRIGAIPAPPPMNSNLRGDLSRKVKTP